MLKEAADPFEMFFLTGKVKRSVSPLHPPPPYNKHNINYCWTKHPSPQTDNTATIHAHHDHHKHYLDHSNDAFNYHTTKAYYTNINSHIATITSK
jgi:hypothetical protein